MSDRAIRTIVVAGAGIVGLSAATAFARALPDANVTVIETPPDPAALADRLPSSTPRITRFHQAIGVSELELVRSRVASHRVATLFADWPSAWAHGLGPYGKPAGAIPFDHVWLRAMRAGDALAYDRYSLGAELGRAGKFVHPAEDPNALGSRFAYALRLDPQGYRGHLERHAIAAGIALIEGEIAEVQQQGGRVAALVIQGGIRVEADLFIDCTGPSAELIGELDDSFEDWSAWMPFDRITLDSRASSGVPSTADRVSASDDGWTADWPLWDRALRALLRIGGDGVPLRLGRRLRPWVGNVLALGDSATALDPLAGLNLDLAQQAILLALELLPGRDFPTVETDEYNRRAEQLTRRVRDFVALHYLCSGRSSGVWPSFAEREPPDSLARTLDQYRYRGRLPFHEEELVSRDEWTAALIGIGVLPQHVDPQAMAVAMDKAVPAMRNLAAEIEQTVGRLPSYAEYLTRMMR